VLANKILSAGLTGFGTAQVNHGRYYGKMRIIIWWLIGKPLCGTIKAALTLHLKTQ